MAKRQINISIKNFYWKNNTNYIQYYTILYNTIQIMYKKFLCIKDFFIHKIHKRLLNSIKHWIYYFYITWYKLMMII